MERRIAIGSNRDGRLEVFYIAKDGSLRHNWQERPNGLWKGEGKLGASATHVACGVNADGRLEVFYVKPDGELVHDWQKVPNGDWQGAHSLKAKAKSVAVASNADGRLEAFWSAAPRLADHAERRLDQ